MKLVILAAGHGTRFGGLKQVAPVGPNGEAIMDYTVRFAEECGYEGVVLVVREEIREQLTEHVRTRWSEALPVDLVCQPAQQGTTYAVLCTERYLDGPFAVANADDLYEPEALRHIRLHFAERQQSPLEPPHVLVGYELTKTVLTAAEVKRGLCRVEPGGQLRSVEEHKVRLRSDGRFDARPLAEEPTTAEREPLLLSGREPVSMNLWGFSPRIFAHLERAAAEHRRGEPSDELLLPQVVGELVRRREEDVRMVTTTSRCYGVTHREDVPLVREHLELRLGLGTVPAALGERGA